MLINYLKISNLQQTYKRYLIKPLFNLVLNNLVVGFRFQ